MGPHFAGREAARGAVRALPPLYDGAVPEDRRLCGQRRVNGRDHGGYRHGQESTGDPEERAACRHCEQHDGRVQVDAAALDHRLEERALEELDRDDQAEDRESELPAPVREADEHRDEAGGERADVRHERADEHEHG